MAEFRIKDHTLHKYLPDPNETEITIPESVQVIAGRAFENCTNLRKVTLPESVKVMGILAFSGCTALKEINLPKGIRKFETGVFYGCALHSARIPEQLKIVENSTFCDCYHLKTVILAKGVKEIGIHAFAKSGLEYIQIPETVEKISDFAFQQCDNIQIFDVSPYNLYFKSIDGNLYSGDGKTLIRYASGKGEKRFRIPDFVTCIKSGAFYCSNPPEIIIPQTVRTIESHALPKGAKLIIEDGNHRNFVIRLTTLLTDDVEILRLQLFSIAPTYRNFQLLPPEWQYQIAVTYYDTDPEIETFLRECIVETAKLYIEFENLQVLEMLFEKGFITSKNIDAVMNLVINHAQETGNFEFQVTVMNYREKYLGYTNPEDNFKL